MKQYPLVKLRFKNFLSFSIYLFKTRMPGLFRFLFPWVLLFMCFFGVLFNLGGVVHDILPWGWSILNPFTVLEHWLVLMPVMFFTLLFLLADIIFYCAMGRWGVVEFFSDHLLIYELGKKIVPRFFRPPIIYYKDIQCLEVLYNDSLWVVHSEEYKGKDGKTYQDEIPTPILFFGNKEEFKEYYELIKEHVPNLKIQERKTVRSKEIREYKF